MARGKRTAALAPRLPSVRAGVAQADPKLQLSVGEPVRYLGLGAGRVVAHETREFQGAPCIFATISFPHRRLDIHLPLGRAGANHKLMPVASPAELEQLIELIGEPGAPLGRSWDEREERGLRVLHKGTARDCAQLLRDYASARRGRFTVLGSDHDLTEEALDLLAAEYASAHACPFARARRLVSGAYERASCEAKIEQKIETAPILDQWDEASAAPLVGLAQ